MAKNGIQVILRFYRGAPCEIQDKQLIHRSIFEAMGIGTDLDSFLDASNQPTVHIHHERASAVRVVLLGVISPALSERGLKTIHMCQSTRQCKH